MHMDRQDESQRFTPRGSQLGANSETRCLPRMLASELAPTLRREDDSVLALIDQLLLNDEADDRQLLWHDLATDLRAHADAEQEIVYRQFAKVRSLRLRAARAAEEHEEIRQLLEEMHDLDPGGARFLARLAKLRYTVARHIESEGMGLLPLAERHFDVASLDKMAEDFVLRKMDLLDDLRSEASFG
jgi:hypothetical protein